MYKLSSSKNYAESYRFNFILPEKKIKEVDFLMGKRLECQHPPIFILNKNISEKRLFSFDFYFSVMISFVSPRLSDLLPSCENIFDDIQLIDSVVLVNGRKYFGYKALNIIKNIEARSCVDFEKSYYKPSDDNPEKIDFYEYVFKENAEENFNIATLTHNGSWKTIIISEKFRKFLEDNKVKGVDLSTEPSPPLYKRK